MRLPSPALVVAVLALVVALGGVAGAATTLVTTRMLANGAVTTPKLKNGAVTAVKIKKGAVTTAKLRAGAVTSAKVRAGAIGTAALAAGAVGTGQLADGAVANAKVAAGSLEADRLTAAARRDLGPIAYAHVRADGSVDASRSRGIAVGAFRTTAVGIYCMETAPAGARTALVALSGIDAAPADLNAVVSVAVTPDAISPTPAFAGCPAAGDDVRVTVNLPGTGLVDRAFTIWFED